MKKLIVFALFQIVLTYDLKAQAITLPEFSNETVVMNVSYVELNKTKPYVALTDGIVHFSVDLKPIVDEREDEPNGPYPQIAEIMSQLKKKGYKLITTENRNNYDTIHFFQKE